MQNDIVWINKFFFFKNIYCTTSYFNKISVKSTKKGGGKKPACFLRSQLFYLLHPGEDVKLLQTFAEVPSG